MDEVAAEGEKVAQEAGQAGNSEVRMPGCQRIRPAGQRTGAQWRPASPPAGASLPCAPPAVGPAPKSPPRRPDLPSSPVPRAFLCVLSMKYSQSPALAL